MRLKQILKEKGMTSKELADKLGVTKPAISQIASGKSNISLSRVKEIASTLGVTVSELLGETSNAVATCPHCGKPITVELH